MKLILGADPEVFVKKSGNLVSCFGLIPGDKKNPHRVNRGAVQVDGMAAEFNIDPAASEEEFVSNLNTVMAQLRGMLDGYDIAADPVAFFGKEYIDAQPEAAKELGCDPDFNAWTANVNPRPDGDAPFRTGAGHIHLGWKDGQEDLNEAIPVVKQMDCYLGIASVLFDNEKGRRALYGRAGACRPKTYGVEYRVLSNAWLRSEAMMRFVYQQAQLGFDRLVNGHFDFERYDNLEDVINNSDVEEAKRIYKDLHGVDYVLQP